MAERPFIASVSQVETFDIEQPAGCELRWLFEYGAGGKRSPQSRGQLDGEFGHAHLAKYLLTGEQPEGRVKMGKAVRAAIEKGELPAPFKGSGDDFHVELRFDGQARHNCDTGRWQEIDLPETLHLGGVPWEGFIDLTFRRDDVPTVLDHKFSSAPRETAKTRDDLLKTVQLPVYVLSQLPYWPDAKRWEIAHHNVSRRGTDSFTVRKVVHLDQVLARKAQIETTVKRLLEVRTSTNHADFRPTPRRRACDAYGGCPHQSRCPEFNGGFKVALSAEEDALFAPLADVTVSPEEAGAHAPDDVVTPAPPEKPARRNLLADAPPPAAPAVPESSVCACGENVNAENGSRLQTGVWKHIGCKLEAVATPPDQPASKPELASEQPAPPPAPKARRGAKKSESESLPLVPPAAPAAFAGERASDRDATAALDAMAAARAAAPAVPPPPAVTAPVHTPSIVRAEPFPTTPLHTHLTDKPAARLALADLLMNLSVLVRETA